MRMIGVFLQFLMALGVASLPLLVGGTAYATPTGWNDPNFQLVWERTDKPVQDLVTARSWMWGPETVPGSPNTEPYVEAPGGNRTVQYFDKSRMEVNNPAGDRSQLWFVTNGLLVREMVSGQMQTGNASFTYKGSSEEAVAGDPSNINVNAPSYSTFRNIASLNNDNPSVPKQGQGVDQTIKKAGDVIDRPSPDPSVRYVYFDETLKHNIPNVFWDFMNQVGPVYWNSAVQNDTVVNWIFAMGLPITEPYWTRAKVGAVEKDVLVQLFERRVLTYTPSNPAGFQVEMGNVGAHYYRWRYHTLAPEGQIVFESDRSGTTQIWTMTVRGEDPKQLTNSAAGNSSPRWSPDNSKIVFTSGRDGNAEIYIMNADGTGQQRLTFDPDHRDITPAWSPDGSRIIWAKMLPNIANADIYTMATNGGDIVQETFGLGDESRPVYSPDGEWFACSTTLQGDPEVYKARFDRNALVRLTFRGGNVSDAPVDWNGNKIMFVSWSGAGHQQLYSMDDDGGNLLMLNGDSTSTGSYSPDGAKIVFQYGLGDDGDIYTANAKGKLQVNITNRNGYDGHPDWSN